MRTEARRASRVGRRLVLALSLSAARASVPGAEAIFEFDRQLDRFPVVAEIDPVGTAPVHEFPPGASVATNLIGRPARWLPPRDEASGMAWVIGRQAGLKPGSGYVLSIEFPDDVPRALFVANRGADHVRGWATGAATGDVRRQYTQPSLESLNYPQSGSWQRYRNLFVLHHRFQGLKSQRDPQPGGRPFAPDDGFHVVLFQSQRINDPLSHGVAVGRIRLHAVPDLAALAAPEPDLPPGVPQRRVFFREEMGDEPVSGRNPEDRACADPVDWFVWKARVSRALGFHTFAKDLLEFGHNQGWDSGDQNWVVNAQPPLADLWDRLVPRIAREGMDLLPYYEYRGALGWNRATPPSLGWQRRAEKLYHGRPNTNYTGTWWVEQHNADLTDPETLADAKRVLDATILKHRDKARFAGAWFRTRGNHLPVSFAEAALARFRADASNDLAKAVSREELIRSSEGDRKLYSAYVEWWLGRRAAFLSGLQEYLARGLNQPGVALLFTPWPGEPVPLLRDPNSGTAGHPIQIATDDPNWWDAFARSQPGSSWFRWAYVPTPFEQVLSRNLYGYSLEFRETISPPPWRSEDYHAAPNADPARYAAVAGVSLTFPIGRLFTVARGDLLETYRGGAGLALIRHSTLNEDNPADASYTGPFGGGVGYACVDVDRAGPLVRLQEARAVANGDPVNLGYLCGSIFSTGFPGAVSRFNQAYLSLPALRSRRLGDACGDPEVVVRQMDTPASGSWFAVVNTSMHEKRAVEVRLPGGKLIDLLERKQVADRPLRLDLYPGELRSYRLERTPSR